MSEESIAALVTAQTQAARHQLTFVDAATAMAGCVDHPETRAMERTLQQYAITWRSVDGALKELYGDSNGDKEEETSHQGWLSGFRSAKTGDDRPFDRELKRSFVQAGNLADQMGSETVSTHHIFLALLGYTERLKEGIDGPVAAADENEDAAGGELIFGGWQLLQYMKTFDPNVRAIDICNSLLKNLKESEDEIGSGNTGPELVTGTASSNKKTATLAECGTDLTLQASDGLLDPVYGRENEIKGCLRTLLRRRKNCVCLIGDAGVGKVSSHTAILKDLRLIVSM